jgi:hypothetical protein
MFSFGRAQHFPKTIDPTASHRTIPLETDSQTNTKLTNPTIYYWPLTIFIGEWKLLTNWADARPSTHQSSVISLGNHL